MAGDQKTGKAQGGGDHIVKPGDATPNEEEQAKIIQGAFRKYKVRKNGEINRQMCNVNI